MKRDENNFLSLLEKLPLNADERVLVDQAIFRLKVKNEAEDKVVGDLRVAFRSLALNQKLSAPGVKFFTQLEKPNFLQDNAMMWSFWLSQIH